MRVVASALAFSLTMSSVAVGQPLESAPAQVAEEMVKAFKTHRPTPILLAATTMTSLLGDERAAFDDGLKKIITVAMDTTGEKQLSGEVGAQVGIAYLSWFISKRPITPSVAAMYESRFKKIDLTTVDAWRAAMAKSGGPTVSSRLLVLAAIGFHDSLFDDGEWRKGNPASSLARLQSLQPQAVSRWEAATGNVARVLVPGSVEPYAGLSLLSVDGLYANDVFQPKVFEVALPAAEKLLSAQR